MLLCRVYPAAFVLLRSIYRFAILVLVETTPSWWLMFILDSLVEFWSMQDRFELDAYFCLVPSYLSALV
jgi:hypothetical protein